jgi:hypothetical protein
VVTAAVQEVVVGGSAGPRRSAAWALLGALTALPAAALLDVPASPAYADVTSLPGTMSTAAQNDSTYAVHVPGGVNVRAVNGVVTMPEVVEGGTISFRVNGAVRKSVPSALYQKVRIPVDPADVIADGTIALTMTTEGPVQPGATCVPAGGVASMRKIELDYRGTELAPTTVADFFPAAAAGITVVIPEDGDAQMITAGLTAVAALAYRYDDDTPITLSLTPPPAETASAGQRVVALVAGRTGEVTTAVSTTSGIPLLTLSGSGDALVNAARSLSVDTLGLSGSDAENPSQQVKPRDTAKTRTLEDLGIDTVALSGYGSVTQRFDLRQDAFGVPISTMDVHLEGSHTAFSDASGARLDVRANGDLVGSTVLGEEARFDLDVQVPASKLRSVNSLELTLNAVAPDGSACTPPSIPPAEVDLDTGASSVTVAHGTGQAKGFQLFPQIFEGTLPIALRAAEGRQASAAINAAALVAELQRAAGSPLEIQLMQPDAFLADDRSGLMIGALSADSEALDAPLELSATRLLDRDDSTFEVTSQDPYAALESIDRNNRLVLMLGSWAPENKAAPGELARKVVDAVVNTGWDSLDGDLVIADEANPAFVAASRSLAPHQVVKEEKSYAKWFVIVIAVLLLLLALQVVIAVRRDRRLTRARDDEFEDDGPAYVEDDEEPDYEIDELGDVDDLGVHEYVAEPGPPESYGEDEDEYDDASDDEDEYDDEFADTGELAAIDADEYDENDELLDDDEDDEDDLGEDAQDEESDEPEPEPEPGSDEESEADDETEEADEDWEDWGDESDELELDQPVPVTGTSPPDETLEADDEDQGEDPESAVEDEEESAIEDEALEPTEEPEPEPEEPEPSPPRRRWKDQQEAQTEPAASEPAKPASTPPVPGKKSQVRRRNRRRR